MSYIITQPNGQLIMTLLDGTADGPDANPGLNSTDINLIGKNYPGYGQLQNENFIDLLQNFANSTPPSKPLPGELWYDTGTGFLKVYTGTGWLAVSPLTVSNAAPTTSTVGAEWYDTTNKQLKLWNGTAWQLIGPGYSAVDGISGAIVENILDTNSISHTVVKMYLNGVVVSIVSNDSTFTPQTTIPGFNTISSGITLSTANSQVFYGTATNAQQLGGIVAANYARTDITTTFAANVNIGSGDLSIDTNSISGWAGISNNRIDGNIDVYNNISGIKTKTLNINGSSGLITVIGDPVLPMHIATKNYVDTSVLTTQNSLTNNYTQAIATAIAPLATINNPALTGTPTATTPSTNDNSTRIATTAFTDAAINNALVGTYAPLASPALTGTPTATTPSTGDNSTRIATTAFSQNLVAGAVALLGNYAPLASPALTGTPTATTPSTGDNSTRIATTAFVSSSLSVSGFAPINNPTFTGSPASTTPSTNDNSTRVATTAFTKLAISSALTGVYAPLNSPAFAGIPTAPTPLSSDNSTAIATTAFTKSVVNLALTGIYAPINSPALTGIPTSTTANTTDNSLRIATTAFTQSAIGAAISSNALWQGSAHFVDTVAPSSNQGNVGDFWFQI